MRLSFPIDPLQPTDTSVPELSAGEKVCVIYLMWLHVKHYSLSTDSGYSTA